MIRLCHATVFALVAASTVLADDGNWPRFRGPDGAGISHATTVPIQWSDQDYNWKVKLPGIGSSSPATWGDRIYVTCGVRETAQRIVVSIDTVGGRVRWQREFPSKTYRQHGDNSYASATPTADADGVVVTWTTPDAVLLVALDPEGREIWRRDLGPFVGARGSGTSPVIFEDLVVLANDQEDPNQLPENANKPDPTRPVGKSFLIAVDRKTGQTCWQLDRRTGIAAYSTPSVYRPDSGTPELLFTATLHGITSVNPATGRVNWEVDGIFRDRCVASAVGGAGLVFGSYGFGIHGDRLVAVRPSPQKEGKKPAIAYDVTKSVPLVPTPLVKDGRLFLWCDDGVVSCMEAATGKTIWRERVGGSFHGSPIWVNGHLYCVARNGDVVVLAATDKFEILARVPLGEPSFATPAVSHGALYLRTHSQLFSLGGKAAGSKPEACPVP